MFSPYLLGLQQFKRRRLSLLFLQLLRQPLRLPLQRGHAGGELVHAGVLHLDGLPETGGLLGQRTLLPGQHVVGGLQLGTLSLQLVQPPGGHLVRADTAPHR